MTPPPGRMCKRPWSMPFKRCRITRADQTPRRRFKLTHYLDGLSQSGPARRSGQSEQKCLRESPRLSPPAETAVVCDTTAYLPSELLASRGIKTISLYVSVDGQQEAESEISDYAGFYERLRASEGGATTSQPSIGDFTAVYE